MFTTTITVNYLEGYGWLPCVLRDGKEIYRGEYERFALAAFVKAMNKLPAEEQTKLQEAV